MTRTTRTRLGRLVGGLVIVAAVLAACSATDTGIVPDSILGGSDGDSEGGSDGGAEPADPTPTPSLDLSGTEGGTDTGSDPHAPRAPEVVRWGGQGQQLAIVIRNQSEVMIRQANTVIEAIGRDGAVIDTATGHEQTTCCSVLGLVPGAEYGLFADLDVPVTQVSSVRVTYVDADFVSVTSYPEPVTTRVLGIDHPAGDTVVRVDIDVHEAASPYLVGQAFLVDTQGRLVGVISGRWYCVGPGTERELRMQLLDPTPAGTSVDRVVVHPVPDGVPPGVTHTCT